MLKTYKLNNSMDLFSKKRDIKLYKQRFTPQKEIISNDDQMDFSFSEWKKNYNIKRSPTTSDIRRNTMIKDIYNNEQKKLVKIHRSFDRRERNNSKIDEMNVYIKRLINEHAILKQRIAFQDQVIRDLNKKNPEKDIDGMNSTPYFTKIQSKIKFPRDVFSSRSKKHRV